MTDKLAKDVATELHRRGRRRRLTFLILWVAVIVALLLYLRCGRGWGIGGDGADEDPGSATSAGSGSAETAGPRRCVVRISSEGITVDGAKMSRDEAVAACKRTEGALITVTGDARQGDWDDLEAALEAAGVPIYSRGR